MSKAKKQRLVLATGNAGKLREVQALLQPLSYELLSQADFAVTEADENGLSFVENALIKARNASHQCGLPALADDSGLLVDSLDGAPGIHSARYAGGNGDKANNTRLLEALSNVPEQQRTASFQCVMVFVRMPSDPVPLIAQGRWQGRILTASLGKNGFGYDPLFWLESENKTAAQLSPARKNQLSHRGQALRYMAEQLAANPPLPIPILDTQES